MNGRRPNVHDDADEEFERLLQQAKAAAGPSPEKQRKQRERFAKVPIWWMEQAMRATRTPKAYVCIWLLFLAWKTGQKSFALPNAQLRHAGVTRETKRRTLAALERAGLLKVERRHGKTVIVTLNY
jgi:hypothetical protein